MENKVTQKEMFANIMEVCAEYPEIVAFCEAQVAKLDAKAEKAKARAAEKRAEGNEFYHSVMEVIGNEPMTRDAVFAAYGDNDGEVTIGKIQAALNWGKNNGVLVAEKTKIEGKEKTVYSKAE